MRGDIVVYGSDICKELSELAYKRYENVIRANNLCLPYRSGSMDAVISVGVLHHFASPQRRLQSVSELSRLLRPGGKLLIYVWAWEQKRRQVRIIPVTFISLLVFIVEIQSMLCNNAHNNDYHNNNNENNSKIQNRISV